VNARAQWADTGINVSVGDYLHVSTTGRVLWAPDSPMVDANGAAIAGSNAPLPGAGNGALVARIGNGEVFLVGTNLDSHRVGVAGRLYLAVNDDIVTDNQGQFRASVVIERRR
jgi:hypothetical protein